MAAISFILRHNNFLFDNVLYHQLNGTWMGNDSVASYACLRIGYLEETVFYPRLTNHFSVSDSNIIKEAFLRYVDDGFLIWSSHLDIDIFKTLLNNLHPGIEYPIEKDKVYEYLRTQYARYSRNTTS